MNRCHQHPHRPTDGDGYYPDGEVEYTGPLTAAALDADELPVVDGAAGYTLSDFASYTQYAYNQYDADLGLFYSSVTDWNGHETDTYKDALGRTVRTVYDDGSFTETLYSFGTTPVSQDQEGDAIANPDGTSWGSSLPSGDQEVVQIAQRQAGDPLVITYDLYNLAGELTDVWQPAIADPQNGNTLTEPHTQYGYDTVGDEVTQTDALGRTTDFTYDANGDQNSRILPADPNDPVGLNLTDHSAYDSLGRELTHTDFKGQVTLYIYSDQLATNDPDYSVTGRLVDEDSFASQSDYDAYLAGDTSKLGDQIHTTYDALGRQLTVTDDSGTTTYGYDPIFRWLTSVDSTEGHIRYSYDSATGQRTRMEVLADDLTTVVEDTRYTYDQQGRLRACYELCPAAGARKGAICDAGGESATGSIDRTQKISTSTAFFLQKGHS